MGTDVSIKPIGAPVAAPSLSLGSAARDAVPMQLPPQQTVMPAELSARLRNDQQRFGEPVTKKVTIDKDAAAIVFQTVDDRTSEVIGQYPAEGMLRRRAYIRALDNAKVATKTVPTDRKI